MIVVFVAVALVAMGVVVHLTIEVVVVSLVMALVAVGVVVVVFRSICSSGTCSSRSGRSVCSV